MTHEATKAREEHLVAAIVVVLVAGHVVENNLIQVYRTKEGRFVVKIKGEDFGILTERDDIFDDGHTAAAYYLDLCDLAPMG